MKCCLSGRQPFTLLDKADEIKIRAGDFRALPDYIERFPEKTLIIELNEELPDFLDFELAKVYNEKMNGNFYIAVDNISQIELCKHYGLKFYYKYDLGAGLVGLADIQPVTAGATGGLGGDDLHNVAVLQLGVDVADAVIHLCAHQCVANAGVNGIGKVDGR